MVQAAAVVDDDDDDDYDDDDVPRALKRRRRQSAVVAVAEDTWGSSLMKTRSTCSNFEKLSLNCWLYCRHLDHHWGQRRDGY